MDALLRSCPSRGDEVVESEKDPKEDCMQEAYLNKGKDKAVIYKGYKVFYPINYKE